MAKQSGAVLDDRGEVLDVARGDTRSTPNEGSPAPVRIGIYEVETVLGVGRAGTVYVCHDRRANRKTAVRLLSPEAAGSPGLEEEVARAAQLDHPNIVRSYGLGKTEDGTPFVVMEHIAGRSLGQYLDAYGPLDAEEALLIATQAARGLAAAAAIGLAHGKPGPSNILLPTAGGVKVADFGWMAERGSPSADRDGMFTLGETLYLMLVGRSLEADPEPDGPDAAGSLERAMPELDGLLVEVVGRLTAVNPTERFPTWDLALDALEAATREVAQGRKPAPQRGLKPVLALLGTAAAIILALGVVVDALAPDSASAASRVDAAAPTVASDGGDIADPRIAPVIPAPAAATTVPTLPETARAQPSLEAAMASAAGGAVAAEGATGYERLYPGPAATELADWQATGPAGRGRPRFPLQIDHQKMYVTAGSRAELWHQASLIGDKAMTIRLRPLSGGKDARVLLMLGNAGSGAKVIAALGDERAPLPDDGRRWLRSGGAPPAGSHPDDPAPKPAVRLLRQAEQRQTELAASRERLLLPGRLAELTLEQVGNTVRLSLAGEVILESQVDGINRARFGLAFPEAAAEIDSIAIRADGGPAATAR